MSGLLPKESELVDHPIINRYLGEISADMIACTADDCDPCDYEAGG